MDSCKKCNTNSVNRKHALVVKDRYHDQKNSCNKSGKCHDYAHNDHIHCDDRIHYDRKYDQELKNTNPHGLIKHDSSHHNCCYNEDYNGRHGCSNYNNYYKPRRRHRHRNTHDYTNTHGLISDHCYCHKYKIKDHIHSRNCCYQDLATYYAGTIEDQDKISFCNPNPNCKYYY